MLGVVADDGLQGVFDTRDYHGLVRRKNQVVSIQTCLAHKISSLKSIELNPAIGPGIVLVSRIGTNRVRGHEKALAWSQLNGLVSLILKKAPPPRQDVVEEVIMGQGWPIMMPGVTLLLAKLNGVEINRRYIMENVKLLLGHGYHLV